MPEVLPELGALAAFAFLVLIAAALWVLQQLLVNSLGKAPLIGSWISSTLNGWLNDARNAVLSGASASWGAGVQMFRWIDAFVHNPITMTILVFTKVYSAIAHLVTVTIPGVSNNLLIWASGEFSRVEADLSTFETNALVAADGLFTRAEADITAVQDQLLLDASALFTRAEQDALTWADEAVAGAANLVTQASTALQAEITSAEALAASEVSALTASTQAAVNQLAADITSGLASAEALAYSQVQALQQGIITDLETTGDAAVSLAWPDAIPDLQALRDTLGADFPWLSDLAGLMAGAGAAGLLGALIRSMATSQALTRLATDCIVPNCRNLSGLGNDLSNLAGLFAAGTIFAWLAEAVADPTAWASDTNSVLAPIGNATVTTARGVFGSQ